MRTEFTLKTARFSPDRVYRYRLARRWASGTGIVAWLLMNPSIADENILDNTLDRCVDFSIRFGFSGLEIINMFGIVSTDPSVLVIHPDPVGPENDQAILDAAAETDFLICGWGALPKPSLVARARRVARTLSCAGHKLHVLGTTKGRSPRHPLYLPQNLSPVEWRDWETMR